MTKKIKPQNSVESIHHLFNVDTIDLQVHDLPHDFSRAEWWYLNAHILTTTNRKLALFASFFKTIIAYDKKKKRPIFGHSVIWALTDTKTKDYHHISMIDKRAPKLLLEQLRTKKIVKDPFIQTALKEMIKKGVVPYPDELLEKEAFLATEKMLINYDGNLLEKNRDGAYLLKLKSNRLKISVELLFTPQKKVIRHGINGVVKGITKEDMFYYFIPQCHVSGKVRIAKESFLTKKANGWYDHQFSLPGNQKKLYSNFEISWNWIGLQLSNGMQLTAYETYDKSIEKFESLSILIDKNSDQQTTHNFKFISVGEEWTSTRTFESYPVKWILEIAQFKFYAEIESSIPNQEFQTLLSRSAFWEGQVKFKGSMNGKKVSGYGYLERLGFLKNKTFKDVLKSVSNITLKSVDKIIPTKLSQDKLEELVSQKGNKSLTVGVDPETYTEALIRPIRALTDRRGKSWRSYAIVAACDAVGGQSQKSIDWLALPELLHVGSMIVDDVQDQSDVRRGGPSIHKLYGQALAINSGNACYFLGQYCIYHTKDNYEKKVQIYNWYFEMMRACHSGQALDIYGLDHKINEALADDSTDLKLCKLVLSIHRLKSAAPSAYLGRLGALLGQGTKRQIEEIATYFESIGLAFQIIDDILNLKGFEGQLKSKAEDISAGKCTYPIAKAIELMNNLERKRLWKIVSIKTKDEKLIDEALALLEKYNVIKRCEREAKMIINKAWKKLDPLLPDTVVKLNLRALSWFALNRTE